MRGDTKKLELSLDKALAITGWMETVELIWLAETVGGLSKIIEVGSYMGRSARAMLDNSEAYIWCVDSWDSSLHIYRSEAYQVFLRNIQDKKERVTVLYMQSAKAAIQLMGLYGPNSFDMVFIDGDHTYPVVKADILAYTPLVRTGGIISGHDYHPRNRGVMRAVDEVIKEFEVVKSIWWIRK